MDTQTALKTFSEIEEKLYAFNHATSMIYYDSVTSAPKDTAEGRGKALGVLSGYSYELTTGAEAQKAVAWLLEHSEELEPARLRAVQEFNRNNEYMSSIPKDEYVEFSMLLNEADSVWHTAKAENDFPAFQPYLEKIFATLRRFAGYYKPQLDPYDVMLDMYERGLTRETADKFFDRLRGRIVPLIKRISEVPQIDDSFLFQSCPVEQQRKLSDYLMEVMCIDRAHCNIGETEHPFTLNFNKNDVRITTHYFENNMASSMFSVIHEGGHALYELNIGDEYDYTTLAGGVSMGIHESQSRLFENIIGRSEAYVNLIYPKLQELFPQQFKNVTARQFYLAINKSQPSLIRTEADELTYPLHIMVRYEIEKALFDGKITVAELPRVWNEKMHEYLGIDVPDDTRGVLQDSHWSGGSVGYFPSYALGSAYGAQMMAKMRETIDVDAVIASGKLAPIVDWLRERIFRHGCRYDPGVLFEMCCGAKFDPEYYVDYLEGKFGEIYGIKAK